MAKPKSKQALGVASLIGKAVFVRAVTHYYTGRLVGIVDNALVLDDAAWIADTGRFAAALGSASLGEVEPYPGRVYVNWGAGVDICEWTHALPRETK